MENLAARVVHLYESLGEFSTGSTVGWQLGELYNVFVDEAQKALPDDPAIAVLDHARERKLTTGRSSTDLSAGVMRAGLRQVSSALER